MKSSRRVNPRPTGRWRTGAFAALALLAVVAVTRCGDAGRDDSEVMLDARSHSDLSSAAFGHPR